LFKIYIYVYGKAQQVRRGGKKGTKRARPHIGLIRTLTRAGKVVSATTGKGVRGDRVGSNILWNNQGVLALECQQRLTFHHKRINKPVEGAEREGGEKQFNSRWQRGSLGGKLVLANVNCPYRVHLMRA